MGYFSKVLTNNIESQDVDSLGRLRTSNNNIIFSSLFYNDDLPLIWDSYENESATISHDSDKSSMMLSVTSNSSDKAIFQTKEYFLYRSGQSHEVRLSLSNFYQVENVIKRVGYFDDYNGVFLESTGDDIAIVLRSSITGSAVDTRIVQENWNIDTFDGYGKSGVCLDWTKSQHLIIDQSWHGCGRIRIGFMNSYPMVYAHVFFKSNCDEHAYSQTATLPIRYEIFNTDTSSGASLEAISQSVTLEGGSDAQGILTYVDTNIISPSTATSTERTILSIKLKDSYIRAFIKPLSVSLYNFAVSNNIKWFVVLNPTVTGTFVWEDCGQSTRKSISQLTYTSGSGHVIGGGFVSNAKEFRSDDISSINSIVGVAASIYGNSDILSIVVQSNDSGPFDCAAGLQYLELF